MPSELSGKVALVTGGTSGIGRETRRRSSRRREPMWWLRAGANRKSSETVELVRAAGGEGLFVKSDVSKASEVDALVQKTVQRFGRLDVAFNNAGTEGVWVSLIRPIRRRLGPDHRHQPQGGLALLEV